MKKSVWIFLFAVLLQSTTLGSSTANRNIQTLFFIVAPHTMRGAARSVSPQCGVCKKIVAREMQPQRERGG